MTKFNRFTKGSGCYVCNICQKRTRRTGDGASVGLCERCYEIGGLMNTLSDNDRGSENYRRAWEDLDNYGVPVSEREGHLEPIH